MLEATTIDAAESICLGRGVGSLRPGKDADLVVIDATAPNMTPLNRARERGATVFTSEYPPRHSLYWCGGQEESTHVPHG